MFKNFIIFLLKTACCFILLLIVERLLNIDRTYYLGFFNGFVLYLLDYIFSGSLRF